MRRTEQAQGLRLMKFEEIYGRTVRGELSQAEAADVLGMSERTFRRWRDRFEADGAEGLYDRRLGRVSARRAPVDEVARVLALFDTRYWDFTAKHFHEKLVAEHGCARSYNWVRLTLQANRRMPPAPRRGAHRRKRPRRALPGMMVHQDGSRHEWVPGCWWDLIVTMDDATSEVYSAFFVDEEGTMSSFRALSEVIGARGRFCSLYADRASHYWHTPDAGGRVDKDNPTQVGRALHQLGIELIPAYSPEARGRSERMFGTLQKRLPQELRLAGITGIEEANRFLKEVYLPLHNARFATPGRGPGLRLRARRRRPRRCPLHPGGAHRLQRQHRALSRAQPADPDRPASPPLRQGKGHSARVSGRNPGHLPWPPMPGTIPGHRRAHRQPNPAGRVSRFDATGQGPVDKWTAAPRLTTSPQANHNNRSGQLIWYINRSNQNVLDTSYRGCGVVTDNGWPQDDRAQTPGHAMTQRHESPERVRP